jgi:peptidoglycan hydrolase-like protein with peptidoglycan-binding domain
VPRYLTLLAAIGALLCLPLATRADEPTRAVQEELRKRKLYFGDVDGRETPSFLDAVKQYQERKGFPVTGQTDPDTLRSLGIAPPTEGRVLPDVTVLRSDRNVNATRTAASAPAVSQPPPKAPPPTRAEMVGWVRRYLEACMTPDLNDELGYYANNVDYFHHGTVRKEDIGRELAAYMQQWPTRRYWLSGPVKLNTSGDHPVVRARITFELEGAGGMRQASGKVDSTFTVARRADSGWEIIAHEEERVRQAARQSGASKRRQAGPALTPLERTLRKFFGTPAKPKKTKQKRR